VGKTERKKQNAVNHQLGSHERSTQFSSQPQPINQGIFATGTCMHGNSFDGSHQSSAFIDKLEVTDAQNPATGLSFDSSFRSGGKALSNMQQKRSLGESFDLSARSFEGDGLNNFSLPQQLGGGERKEKRKEKREKKVTKLKKMLRFGKKD